MKNILLELNEKLNKYNTGIDVIRNSITVSLNSVIYDTPTEIFKSCKRDVSLYDMLKIVKIISDDKFLLNDMVFGFAICDTFIEGEVFNDKNELFILRITMD